MNAQAQPPRPAAKGRKSRGKTNVWQAPAAQPDVSGDVRQMAAAQLTARHAARHEEIAREAYFRAERRGFTPGYELDDWLAAEAAVEDQTPRACLDDPVGTEAASAADGPLP